MNKKFSTLAVAAMLASAFTAYAGPGDGDVVTYLQEGSNGKAYQLHAVYGSSDTKLGFLTLNGDDELTFVKDATGSEFALEEGDFTRGASLWCVNVTRENAGKNPIFDFTNKAYGKVLDVTVGGYTTWGKTINNKDLTTAKVGSLSHIGGEVAGWEFAPILGTANGSTKMFGYNKAIDATSTTGLTYYALRSYINQNLVATLVYDESADVATTAKNEGIKVAVVAADKLDEVADYEIKFVLNEAKSFDLTAAEFNTVLFTQKEDFRKLTFDKDYNNTDIVNPFSTNDLMAESADDDFVYLYKKEADGTKSYLRVDTAYANDYGVNFLKFAFGSKFGKDGKSNDAASEQIIPNQYKFRLNYCLTEDSLSIQVKEARYLKEGESWWNDVDKDGKFTSLNNDGIEIYLWNGAESNPDVEDAEPEGGYVHNWVKLQDLVTSQEIRIVTVGKKAINTHVSFGFGDCTAVQAEYTSVADGVYYIKNAKGQYLAHPIYHYGSEKPLFVTVNADEQDVAHMPAYQWVVLKEYNENAGTREFSPVMIANREYDNNFTSPSVQLKQAAGAQYMYASGNVINGVAVDSLQFVAVPQSSIEDPYLGYKKLTKDELTTGGKYTFNYWHPYAQDKYIAQAENDSTFTVWNEISAFDIDTVAYNPSYKGIWNTTNGTVTISEKDAENVNEIVDRPTVDIAYGFVPANVKDGNGNLRIKGLAQLVRTAYQVSLNGSELKVNENDQFNTGKNSWAYGKDENDGVQKFDHYIAFFKENMHVDGQHYYAILKAENTKTLALQYKEGKSLGYSLYVDKYKEEYAKDDVQKENPYYVNSEYVISPYKAGVSDYDGAATLKNQVLEETRTSAFAINRDETPLYRRFNSAALEGQAGDGVDTLRFYEKYRGEYLMIEANKNFMVEHIDFLGIDAQDKAQGGLAFIVDTAWVNRGAGNIKPQYLISIDRHDFDGVAGEPCTESGPHIDESGHITDDPYACVHAHKAVPGFKRGKFLINFHDFANSKDMVGADKYKWAEYDRAGFKEAIIVKDTMYILRDEFKNLANEEIDLAKLASAEVEALRAWTNDPDAAKNGQTAANFLSYRYELTGDNHKYVTWSMRFFDRSVAANEVEADRSFLFESMKSLAADANDAHGEKDVHNGKYSIESGDGDIAPVQAAWLKMQNGCLVLSKENSKFDDVTTGSDDALIFNVEHVCGDQVAVDNENIAVEGVSVVAGNGQVTIMGAAGKNVTITNILGKVIANQTIASDNATIAVPAGIVAVAVEGEAAVKAIVK